MINHQLIIARFKLEAAEEWHEWEMKIPALEFKPGWKVQVIPPFAGAMVRFRVGYGGKVASVYLDCHNALGFGPGPYWEVYPVRGENLRVDINNVAGLLALIEEALQPDIEGEPTREGIPDTKRLPGGAADDSNP